MRVAFSMINCNRRDGSARAVNEVAERLAARGHEVDVFARKAEDLDLTKVRWQRVPGPGWPEVVDFVSYHYLAGLQIRRKAYDIVHSIGPNAAGADVVTIQNIQPAKMKILASLGSEEAVSFPRRLTRAAYLRTTSGAERKIYPRGKSDRPLTFLPVSVGVERELKDYYPVIPEAVRRIPNAADLTIFRLADQSDRQRWRREQGYGEDECVAIFAGGEWARKGLDLAIQGLALCKDRSLKLFVAGDDADRIRFERMATDLAVADRVSFGGFRKDMALAMGSCDLLLFPSRYEAFSLATIEAAACGLPIVAARINGTEEFIQPGITGEFIEHDAGHIARTIDMLLMNRANLKEMGLAGRRLVEREYTWDRVTDLTEEAYKCHLERMDVWRKRFQ